MLPTYEVWKELVYVPRSRGTPEWLAVDSAYREYSANPSNQAHKDRLVTALEVFDEKKRDSSGVVRTRRDAAGAITALRRHLARSRPDRNPAEISALSELEWAQRQAIFRCLANAQIQYKKGSTWKMGQEAVKSGNQLMTDLKAIPGFSNSSGPVTTGHAPTHSLVNSASAQWESLVDSITCLAEELQRDAIDALNRELGPTTMKAISDAIPVLGTVKNGADILIKLKAIVDNQRTKHKIDHARAYTRSGDIQIAIDNMQQILSGRRVDLGIEFASSITTFTSGVVTGGMAAPVASAATSAARFLYTIYIFVADYVAMRRANETLGRVMGAQRPIIETMGKFPFLGAYLIATIETSTLLECNGLDIGDPFFEITIKRYRSQVEIIERTARDIVSKSRFEITSSQRIDDAIKLVRERFRNNLADELPTAVIKREKERAKCQELQRQVQQALATYRAQTSGVHSLVTRQSAESTAAIIVLTPLATSGVFEDLTKLRRVVEYLLRKPGAVSPPPGTVHMPLKQRSRLNDLLTTAYNAARL